LKRFQKPDGGVDLYLASFGPAAGESRANCPLKRGTPRLSRSPKRRKQADCSKKSFDPYAVTPREPSDAARVR